MNKYIFAILTAFVFIFPQLTHAIWWNPFTWNEQDYSNVQQTPTTVSTQLPEQDNSPSPTVSINPTLKPEVIYQDRIVEKVIEKPVERVVTKTITIDNPALLTQIQSLQEKLTKLTEENLRLSGTILSQASSTESLNRCIVALRSMEEAAAKQPNINNQCSLAKNAYKTATDKKFALDKRRDDLRSQGKGMGEAYDEALRPITVEIERAQRDMIVYCQ